MKFTPVDDLSSDLADEARKARMELVEKLADFDEPIMDLISFKFATGFNLRCCIFNLESHQFMTLVKKHSHVSQIVENAEYMRLALHAGQI